jgi:hypothetical protein
MEDGGSSPTPKSTPAPVTKKPTEKSADLGKEVQQLQQKQKPQLKKHCT